MRGRALYAVVAVAVLAVALALGVLLPRLRAGRESPAAVSSAAGAASDPVGQTLVDRLATADALTEPPPADVRYVDDLSEVPPGPVERLEVAYFHRTHRCSGCIKAEEFTRKTLDTYYRDRLESGDMVLLVEDVQQPSDPALVRKYDAFGSSLYLGVVKDGVTYVYADTDVFLTGGEFDKFAALFRQHIDSVFSGQ